MSNNFLSVSEYLLSSAFKSKLYGYDPYDGLNSYFIWPFVFLKQSFVGLCWIQFCKLSPVNFRRLLLVPKALNPKGVALFISGLLQDYQRTQDARFLKQAQELGDWLLTQQCDKGVWTHPCWGYHFDWKARAFFVPKGKPNVITTVYVSRALYELGVLAQREDMRLSALASADFMVEHLATKLDGREFFAYIPGETAFVHNASLWAAAWVAFAAKQTNNPSLQDLALRVARQSVGEQRPDGSWVYGARKHHQFVDGFHTGYNLEALHEIRNALGVSEFDAAIASGLAYYKAHFFEADGAAKYYNNNRYPLDMHSVAQAVFTLLRVGGEPDDWRLAEKTLQWSMNTLYLPKQQRFAYQITPLYTNKINYVRWTQAWAYFALAFYNRYKATTDAKN